MTDAELSDNAWSMVGVDPGAPTVEENLLLLEPLAEAAGVHHIGDDIFESTSDPAYLCLASWLRHAVDAAACAEATAAVALPSELPAP